MVVTLASAASSCRDASGEHPASRVDAREAASDALNAIANIEAGEEDGTIFLHELELDPTGFNPNDWHLRNPGALPTALGGAEFGFFDDDAILDQLPRRQLVEMVQGDGGFRFVADLDRDGEPEHYRTGWFRLPGQQLGQFLAVFEDFAFRDVWVAEADEPISISWRHAAPVLYACNCPRRAAIVYRGDKLHMTWREDGGRFPDPARPQTTDETR